jgi:hypothetical protein
VSGELDVIGLGRPVIADPDIPKRILSGESRSCDQSRSAHSISSPWHSMQLERLADGLEPDLSLHGADAAAQFVEIESRNMTTLLQHRAKASA